MVLAVVVRAVGRGSRVEVATGGHAVAAGAVALVMHMEAMLAAGREATHFTCHQHRVALLDEGHRADRRIACGGCQLRRATRPDG